MKKINKLENISSIFMSFFGIGLILNLVLIQFFSIGIKSNIFTIIYCILFVLMTIEFESIIRKKSVMIPIYIDNPNSYSLITTYILKL